MERQISDRTVAEVRSTKMTFDEVLAQVLSLLQREGRVSYKALKRRFNLDDGYLEDLKVEIIKAKQLAIDEDGDVLVWAGDAQQAARLGAARTSEAERRQLTVMFCDLVGSTPLAEHLDIEDLRDVVQMYQETGAEVIRRYDGHIAQYQGDGLLVYFGYPIAHEDDAQRAVRAGLDIVAKLPHLNAYLQQEIRAMQTWPLQVRIGIHTGLAVIGEMGGEDRRTEMALGETLNIASRLQDIAEPNTAVISNATQRLVEGLFECQALGPQALKGVSTPVSVYRVLRESEAQTRFEVAVRTGLTPLVGRREEMERLRQYWKQAQSGHGQVVLVSGEAGIGKSRLMQELKEQIVREQGTSLEMRCSPYYQNSVLYPVIEYLQRVLGFQREDASFAKIEKLERTLSSYRFPQADTVPLCAALLSLPSPQGYPPLNLSPQRQKQKTREVLVAWLLEESERNAVYSVWEDLHWADSSTLELVSLCLERIPTSHALVLLTFRPEFTPPWGVLSHLSEISLSRLENSHAEEMVKEIAKGNILPSEVVQQVVAKTDGIPLFVEELTKMLMESGSPKLDKEDRSFRRLTGSRPPLAIPSTLQDSLRARLDRLPLAKEVAQLGATIGREFTYELLRAVSSLDERTLQHRLMQLVKAEFLYQSNLPPQARYIFKHALVQETAYQSLLKSKRRQVHQQIARILEEQFPNIIETQPELVASHYTEAGLVDQAIPYWQRAGERAIKCSANKEAIEHFNKGLELLKVLPDVPERTQQELALQLDLGVSLIATRGYAASEVQYAYARARDLCGQLGEAPELSRVLSGLWEFYATRAEIQTAYELAEQFLNLAQQLGDPALLLEAHQLLGVNLFYRGELISAQSHLEQAIALYDPLQHRSHAFLYGGADPGVVSLAYAAWILWWLGYPDQALKRSNESLTLAQDLAHPFSLAGALNWAAVVHLLRREGQAAQERAEEATAFSTEQGFPTWVAMGTVSRGAALTEQGQVDEGITLMRLGMAAWRNTGQELGQPSFLTQLALAYLKKGQVEEGLAQLTEGLEVMHKTGERALESGLYALKGMLSLLSPSMDDQAEAEASFRWAIDKACEQGAKSLELRATMGLCFLLWQQQGKTDEARQMLAEIYNWFTEGFDTADLREAKALLEALA